MKSLIAANALLALSSTAQAVPTVTILVADNGIAIFSRMFTNTVQAFEPGVRQLGE